MDWCLPFDDAGLPRLTGRPSVLLDEINPFNYQALILRLGETHLAFFASIPTGNNYYGIILSNFHNLFQNKPRL